jgi:hypothetical protein
MFNSPIWRDVLVSNLKNSQTLFRAIFDKFRERMRDTTNNLNYMREGSNIVYIPSKHSFFLLQYPWSDNCPNNKEKFLRYPEMFTKGSSIYSELRFEDFVKDKQMKYHIEHLDKIYYYLLNLKQDQTTKIVQLRNIALIKCIIPILRQKYSKSIKSFYRFIDKIEEGKLKTYNEKLITKVNKHKIIRIKHNLENLREEKIKKKEIYCLIKGIEASNTHSNKIRNIKDKLKLILTNYLNNTQDIELGNISFSKFKKDLSIHLPNIEARKLINYLPDHLFSSLKSVIKFE